MAKEAFVTLATTDEYAIGAIILAFSLKRVGTTRSIVCMVTNTVNQKLRSAMEKVFNEVVLVDVLNSRDTENLSLLKRPELGVTFTKFHCWRLTQYTKCIFMDADCLAVANIDDLFEREELSAAPDPGWPDTFNSGLFVFTPSQKTYLALLNFALEESSFDGGDQGLLNIFFKDWFLQGNKYRLRYTDNCMISLVYSYAPAIKRYWRDIRVIHFIGDKKPWVLHINEKTGELCISESTDFFTKHYHEAWWNFYLTKVQPLVSFLECGRVGEMARMKVTHGPILDMYDEPRVTKSLKKWERGEIDYLGHDAFKFIKEKLDETINRNQEPRASKGAKVAEEERKVDEEARTKEDENSTKNQKPTKKETSTKKEEQKKEQEPKKKEKPTKHE